MAHLLACHCAEVCVYSTWWRQNLNSPRTLQILQSQTKSNIASRFSSILRKWVEGLLRFCG
eukprot:300424-Amphidinium_carterae.1